MERSTEGATLTEGLGSCVGPLEETLEGCEDTKTVGSPDAERLGSCVGPLEGTLVGCEDP